MSSTTPDPTHAEPETGSNRESIRRLVGGHRRTVGSIAFTATLAGFAEAATLATVSQIAAALLSNSDHVRLNLGVVDITLSMGTLIWLSGGLVLARLALLMLNTMSQARLGAEVQADLRNNLFAAFTRASWTAQSLDTEGHLQEQLSSQALQASWGANYLASLVSALFTFIVLLISAMILSPLTAALVIVVAGVLSLLLRPLSALGQRRTAELSQAQMNYASGVGEANRLAEESSVFGTGELQRDSLETLVDRTRTLVLHSGFINRLTPILFQSAIFLTVVAGLGALYWTGVGAVTALGAVVLMLVRAGTYGREVHGSYQLLRQSLPFVDRVHDGTARYEAHPSEWGSSSMSEISGLSFKDVSYAYKENRPVLRDVSFDISQGEVIGIVGPSGAGKSTLVQLLLQLRTPDSGTYSLNGRSVSEYSSEDWHRQISYVPQEPKLIHATVADNIRFHREIDDGQIEHAAKLARIHDEVLSWDGGYDRIVGPRADSVSGGQQQRLCLARALAADPSVLVLDEPTSALDPRSESLIQDSLGELADQLTVFIVTHRMSTLTVCNRVIVIADNRLDGFGTPEELARTNEYFNGALRLSSRAQSPAATT